MSVSCPWHRFGFFGVVALVIAAQPLQAAPPETIIILGKSFRVVPFQIEDTPRSWADVRPYLPRVLLQKPKESLTKKQILAKIDGLLHATEKQYDSDLDALTDRYLEDFLKTTPQANWDWFNLQLAGDCLADKPGPYLPESTVRLCQQYTALLYLQDMIDKAPLSPPQYPPPRASKSVGARFGLRNSGRGRIEQRSVVVFRLIHAR